MRCTLSPSREAVAVLHLEDALSQEVSESLRRSLKVGGIETVVYKVNGE